MADRNPQTLHVIIECPSGGKLVIPGDHINAREGMSLMDTVKTTLTLDELAIRGVWEHAPIQADFDLWKHQMTMHGAPTSFVIKITPDPAPTKRPGIFLTPREAREIIGALNGVGADVHALTDVIMSAQVSARAEKIHARVVTIIGVLREELADGDAPHAPRQPHAPKDGWGHTLDDNTLEGLLKELFASEAGTDRHEAALKQLLGADGDKLALYRLYAEFAAFKKQTDKDLQVLHAQVIVTRTEHGELKEKLGRAVAQITAAFDPESGEGPDDFA